VGGLADLTGGRIRTGRDGKVPEGEKGKGRGNVSVRQGKVGKIRQDKKDAVRPVSATPASRRVKDQVFC
jgi:hypothetical protein